MNNQITDEIKQEIMIELNEVCSFVTDDFDLGIDENTRTYKVEYQTNIKENDTCTVISDMTTLASTEKTGTTVETFVVRGVVGKDSFSLRDILSSGRVFI